jgi:ubiquinone/menaquinone biosynthesis C-methylase UbiE
LTQPNDPQGWDEYWNRKDRASGRIYDLIATAYRTLVIRRNLEAVVFRTFPDGSHLLHAGCGSGGVDTNLHHRMRITAVDTSGGALRRYRETNPQAFEVREADIFSLPFPDETFDGVYNLGVLEHFTVDEITRILVELKRVTKSRGKLVIFWPHARASSVAVLKVAHWLLRFASEKPTALHPPEISLVKSRAWVNEIFSRAGLALKQYSFGARDFFIQAVIVAEKKSSHTR